MQVYLATVEINTSRKYIDSSYLAVILMFFARILVYFRVMLFCKIAYLCLTNVLEMLMNNKSLMKGCPHRKLIANNWFSHLQHKACTDITCLMPAMPSVTQPKH